MNIAFAYRLLFQGALIWFGILIFVMLIRSVIGPRITDRILSINMIGTMVICSICILSVFLDESYLVDVALIYAMISFVAVLIFAATYIPGKKGRGKFAKDAGEEIRQEEQRTKQLERFLQTDTDEADPEAFVLRQRREREAFEQMQQRSLEAFMQKQREEQETFKRKQDALRSLESGTEGGKNTGSQSRETESNPSRKTDISTGGQEK